MQKSGSLKALTISGVPHAVCQNLKPPPPKETGGLVIYPLVLLGGQNNIPCTILCLQIVSMQHNVL